MRGCTPIRASTRFLITIGTLLVVLAIGTLAFTFRGAIYRKVHQKLWPKTYRAAEARAYKFREIPSGKILCSY